MGVSSAFPTSLQRSITHCSTRMFSPNPGHRNRPLLARRNQFTRKTFGGRRQALIPLVYESFDWQHGTFLGATLASETTAAATGAVGVVRRDPMAMLPFCGYNMADYWAHWLATGKRLSRPPKVFRVNWFRRDESGRFLWPGFGENLRVLQWVIERCKGVGKADETPIGFLPTRSAINREGLDVSDDALAALLAVDREGWRVTLRGQAEFFEKFEDRLPPGIRAEHDGLARRLRSR